MAKAKKSTIKFQKNHLKGAIEKRRQKQKATQIYKKRNPKKFGRGAQGSKDGASAGDEEDGNEGEEETEEKQDSGDE
ncbi:hypothetical protein BG004_006052, partial [Podila humilis]